MEKSESTERVPTLALTFPLAGRFCKHFHVPLGMKKTEAGWKVRYGIVLLIGKQATNEQVLVKLVVCGDAIGKFSSRADHYLDLVWRENHPEQYANA